MKPLLRFNGVTLRRGGRLLFEQFDLELAPGEIFLVPAYLQNRQLKSLASQTSLLRVTIPQL